MRVVRLWCCLLVGSAVVSACGGSSTTSGTPATASTSAPPATDRPAPTEAPATSESPATTEPRATTTVADDGCAFGAPTAAGEVTWIKDGRLEAVDADGTTRCLLDGVTSEAPIEWSATADRVLLDPSTVESAAGTRASGFDATNETVSWSAPSGKALISIDPATHHLLWHSSTSSNAQDITFLARTDAAVYHPAGKGIAAVGLDETGVYGIWLASNRGENRQLITAIEDPGTPPTDLAFSADGLSLEFIHKAVHRLVLADLTLQELGDESRNEANLTVSTVDPGAAFTTGPCDGKGSIIANAVDLRSAAGSPFAGAATTLRPVGWLSGLRLVIAARPARCDGPADVWIWSSSTNSFEQIGSKVNAVAVRIPHGPFQELPPRIEQQAPG